MQQELLETEAELARVREQLSSILHCRSLFVSPLSFNTSNGAPCLKQVSGALEAGRQVRPQGKADFLVLKQCLSDPKRCLSLRSVGGGGGGQRPRGGAAAAGGRARVGPGPAGGERGGGGGRAGAVGGGERRSEGGGRRAVASPGGLAGRSAGRAVRRPAAGRGGGGGTVGGGGGDGHGGGARGWLGGDPAGEQPEGHGTRAGRPRLCLVCSPLHSWLRQRLSWRSGDGWADAGNGGEAAAGGQAGWVGA